MQNVRGPAKLEENKTYHLPAAGTRPRRSRARRRTPAAGAARRSPAGHSSAGSRPRRRTAVASLAGICIARS